MKKCTSCNATLSDETRVCQFCGTVSNASDATVKTEDSQFTYNNTDNTAYQAPNNPYGNTNPQGNQQLYQQQPYAGIQPYNQSNYSNQPPYQQPYTGNQPPYQQPYGPQPPYGYYRQPLPDVITGGEKAGAFFLGVGTALLGIIFAVLLGASFYNMHKTSKANGQFNRAKTQLKFFWGGFAAGLGAAFLFGVFIGIIGSYSYY